MAIQIALRVHPSSRSLISLGCATHRCTQGASRDDSLKSPAPHAGQPCLLGGVQQPPHHIHCGEHLVPSTPSLPSSNHKGSAWRATGWQLLAAVAEQASHRRVHCCHSSRRFGQGCKYNASLKSCIPARHETANQLRLAHAADLQMPLQLFDSCLDACGHCSHFLTCTPTVNSNGPM